MRTEGKSRHEVGREPFIERVWEWKKDYGCVVVRSPTVVTHLMMSLLMARVMRECVGDEDEHDEDVLMVRVWVIRMRTMVSTMMVTVRV